MNNAKDYLLQIRMLDAKLKSIEENIEAIRRERQSLGDISLHSPWPDGQPRGTVTSDPTGNQATRNADKYEEKREELARRLREYEHQQILTRSELWSKRMEILAVLDKVPDPLCYQLLVLRYVECRKWEWIAVELDKTYQWVAGPLHGRALVLVDEILKKIKLNRIT